MFENYNLLSTMPLQKHSTFYHPEKAHDLVNLNSPALQVFTDFLGKPPETTRAEATLDQALNEMIVTKVKSLLVVDENEDIIGLISSHHIHSPTVPGIAHSHHLTVKELPVKLVMTPLEQLETLDYNEVSNARVGHIARLMHELGVQHLLVIETPTHSVRQMVRGIFSASRISRQLGTPILSDLSSHSIAEIHRRR